MNRTLSSVLVTLTLTFALAAPGAQADPPAQPAIGDTAVLAPIPASPGSPEGIAVNGHKVYVSAAAKFGTQGNNSPSQIYVIDVRYGTLLDTISLQGENQNLEHGVAGMAFDANGMLYVVSQQLGVMRIDPANPTQQVLYGSAFPDFPACGSAPCTPTQLDLPPLPNDIAFDDAGNCVRDRLAAGDHLAPRAGWRAAAGLVLGCAP